MTTEVELVKPVIEAKPVVEEVKPQEPIVETVETQTQQQPQQTQVQSTVEEPKVSGEAPREDWRDKRIGVLTAKLRESERLRQQAPAAPAVEDEESRIESRAELRAREIAEANAWNARCNACAEEGRKEFPDFNAQIDRLKSLVDFNDQGEVQKYSALITAAMDAGAGHKIIHALGSNPEEASRILGLNPMKMAVEITKMALNPQTVSNAPKPIVPVGGGRGGARQEIDPDDAERADRLTTKEWMARREKQVMERYPDMRRRAH